MSDLSVLTERMLQLLYPPRCLFCDIILPPDGSCERCADAAKRLKRVGEQRTNHTGRNLANLGVVVSSFIYTGAVSDAVARYKFEGKRDLYRDMVAYMVEDVTDCIDAAVDLVAHVPSGRGGGDHAKLLAKGMAQRLQIPFAAVLSKIRKTEKQHILTRQGRVTNIKDAFAVRHPDILKEKTVLLCDDVVTSGNTLNECAAALRRAGAKQVYACVFCATAQDWD